MAIAITYSQALDLSIFDKVAIEGVQYRLIEEGDFESEATDKYESAPLTFTDGVTTYRTYLLRYPTRSSDWDYYEEGFTDVEIINE